jgi:hypothetical protein
VPLAVPEATIWEHDLKVEIDAEIDASMHVGPTNIFLLTPKK